MPDGQRIYGDPFPYFGSRETTLFTGKLVSYDDESVCGHRGPSGITQPCVRVHTQCGATVFVLCLLLPEVIIPHMPPLD